MLMVQDYFSLFKNFQHKWGGVEWLLHHVAFWKCWWLLSIDTSSSSTWWQAAFAFYKVVPFAWKTSWHSIRIYNSQTSSGLNKDKDVWVWTVLQSCSLASHLSTCHSSRDALPAHSAIIDSPTNHKIFHLLKLFSSWASWMTTSTIPLVPFGSSPPLKLTATQVWPSSSPVQ